MMAVYNSGPVNIEQGNSANFTVEFFDSTGTLTVPSSGNMTITYTNISNVSQTDNITLSLGGSFFTGTWSSAAAALGLATWVATMAGSTTTQATGQLRIIQRQGN